MIRLHSSALTSTSTFRKAFGDNHYLSNRASQNNEVHDAAYRDQRLSPYVDSKFGGFNKSGGYGLKEKFRENVEIFRKAFGDSHYFVKAGREGLFSKGDEFAKDEFQVSSSSIGGNSHQSNLSKEKFLEIEIEGSEGEKDDEFASGIGDGAHRSTSMRKLLALSS